MDRKRISGAGYRLKAKKKSKQVADVVAMAKII